MINYNQTSILNFLEIYYDIKFSKNKQKLVFQRLKDIIVLQLEKFKRETNSISEQYFLMNKYLSFDITDKINIHTISEDFFVDIFNLNLLNPDWYIESKHEIQNIIFIAAALYKAGIDLTSDKYFNLKNLTNFFNFRTAVFKYKKEDKGIRKSINYTYFSIYLKKITEEEIVNILKQLNDTTRKDKLQDDIMFELLKRS